MNHEQAFQLVGQANPLSGDSTGPDGFLSMTALLDRIDERSTDVQTQERPRTDERGPGDRRPRWLIPALAAAAAVILAIVVGALLLAGGSDEPDVIEPSPTTLSEQGAPTAAELGAALDAAARAGDWEAVVAYFAPDATYRWGPDASGLSDSIPWADPAIFFAAYGERAIDWDGDFVRSGFDQLSHDVMWAYALGFSWFGGCTATDAATLECEIRWDEVPFGNPARGVFLATYTVVDGLIAETTIVDLGLVMDTTVLLDRAAAGEYEAWARANRQELNEDGALFRLNPGDLTITPETVERHRQLIAEWQETR